MLNITSWWHTLGMQSRLQIMTQFFVIITLVSSQYWVQHTFEDRAYSAAETRATVIAESLLNGANMMMLTGTISDAEQRQIFIEKMSQLEDVKKLSLIRSSVVVKQHGTGNASEQPSDDQEKLVIQQKQTIIEHGEDAKGSAHLRVLVPFGADANHNGTNCLACHQAKPSDILGAASVTIDMNQEVQELNQLSIMMWIGQLVIQIFLFLIIRTIARSITNPVITLQQTMATMEKSSNLTDRAALGHHQDEIYTMAGAFNGLVARLQNMIKSVHSSSTQVKQASHDLTNTAQVVLRSTERQRVRAEEVAQSVQTIRSNVTEVNHRVEQASGISEEAWKVADQGTNVVRMTADTSEHLAKEVSQMADAVSKLGEQSERVSGIVSTIGDIAEQTNLLALNAAIEAARAGDQGRGFAVVAEEVRALSVRTSQATGEITEVIRTIQIETGLAVNRMRTTVEQVQLGVQYSHEAEEALTRIRDASTRTSDRINDIAMAMKQQLHEADRIAREVSEIASMTDENFNAMRQTLSASERMQGLANDLEDQVHRFKVN